MHGTGPPPRRRPLLAYGLVRWTIAAGVGATVTAALFLSMTRLIDGSWILDGLLRIFPLQQTEGVDPCEVWEPEQTLETIEGTVGYLAEGGFVALPGATVIGQHGRAAPQRVDVSATGGFRFVASFPEPRPETCGRSPQPLHSSARLLIEAPGCTARSVPITRGWLAHRVLLQCEERP